MPPRPASEKRVDLIAIGAPMNLDPAGWGRVDYFDRVLAGRYAQGQQGTLRPSDDLFRDAAEEHPLGSRSPVQDGCLGFSLRRCSPVDASAPAQGNHYRIPDLKLMPIRDRSSRTAALSLSIQCHTR